MALVVLLVAVLVPMAALLLYGLTERWDRHWWPEGPTLRWIGEAVLDPRVQGAVLRTVLLALASAVLALVCGGLATIPAALALQLDDGASARRLRRMLDLLSLLPFAIAPVVIAISALELFVGRWGGWLPLPLVYVAVVAPTLFPLIHKTLQAALAQLNAAALIEAGRTLGASDGHTLRRVLLPMLAPALLAAFLLAWVTAAMEFAIANLLLGGQMELLQPLMNSLRNVNGHQAAALMVLAFAGVGAIVALAARLTRRWTASSH
ncbi:MAG: ABC transporter permease subunit [Mitsuaria chitosanitabida]|uniref:ABC transporter permease subunit n=1 Tax=Roseateles chitosanitabidus TaxID=65048 RepID=UPI001AFF3C6D|nr:ABC transporter permease subunit [Roseateles chitosanitabidus]MBO9689306.1 ABC transporter permease subunit [Roseateles chitosanitabidus]